MFGKKRKLEETLAIEAFKTIIDASTSMEGRMNFANSVRIDGKIVGDLLVDSGAAGIIAVGPDAEVRGNIDAHRVLVAGKVHGNIRAADSVHLMSTAKVSGDISYASISIECGARVNGLLVDLMKNEAAPGAAREAAPAGVNAHEQRSNH
ncbi:MAG TPA: polymer-forming cytoskeletal protein [Burkholderiales bacterium]|jgi:Integral membrane protein CcmA involved in cell shape determination